MSQSVKTIKNATEVYLVFSILLQGMLNWTLVNYLVVSASYVTSTECWLNVWCIWYTYLETLQEFRSHQWICWIIQDFRETCVSCSLTFRLETKMPWRQTPSRKKKAAEFTTDDERLSGSTKHWIFKSMWNIFKVCGIESLKYVQEFYTPVCYCGYIATWHKTKHDWLLYLSVIWPLGRALAI